LTHINAAQSAGLATGKLSIFLPTQTTSLRQNAKNAGLLVGIGHVTEKENKQ